MSKEQFLKARQDTWNYLRENKVENHMFHGPVSDQFWNSKIRMIAINMESYGYDGHCEADRAMLTDWLYDAGGTDTRTVRYTLAILAALKQRIIDGNSPSYEKFQEIYINNDLLERTLDETVYYNIRPESNPNKEQDYAAIAAVGDSLIGSLLWGEIQSFDPQIIIVSGQAGLTALNGIASLNPPLHFRESMRHSDGFIIQSIAHPSRPNYEAWSSTIEQITSKLKS